MNQVVFLNQKNKWNMGAKTKKIIFDFQVLRTTKLAHILMKMDHFWKSNIFSYEDFTKNYRFWFKNFLNVLYKKSIFLASEACLSPNLQNWIKSLSFHDSGLSGQLSFGRLNWKSLGLNYSSGVGKMIMLNIKWAQIINNDWLQTG